MKVLYKTVQEIDHAATGAKARELREAKKKSLRKTAIALGVSAAYLSDLELGRRGWTQERADEFQNAITKH